jgi:hypothetical protein
MTWQRLKRFLKDHERSIRTWIAILGAVGFLVVFILKPGGRLELGARFLAAWSVLSIWSFWYFDAFRRFPKKARSPWLRVFAQSLMISAYLLIVFSITLVLIALPRRIP